MTAIQFIDRALPGQPVLDTAVSRALLQRVARGECPETFRLYRPDDVLAFSLADRNRPGFARAVAAARSAGFAPVLRLAGGQAALFHTRTLAFAWARPVTDPRAEVSQRFDEMAEILAEALRSLGVDARLGEVPGEYCPGAHSINARGRTKLAGIGQRLIRGAAHVGGVLVVAASERVREGLEPVYRELDLPMDPAAVGSVEDEVGALDVGAVSQAIHRALDRRRPVEAAPLEPAVLDAAAALCAQHAVDAAPSARAGSSARPLGAKSTVESTV